MDSIITTKKGDQGSSTLPDGRVVSKSSELIECLGSLETLRAHLALLKIKIDNTNSPQKQSLSEFLMWLLHCIFITGSQLADPSKKVTPSDHPKISKEHLEILENFQLHLEKKVSLPRKFIVCGSNEISGYADIVVSTARNFERKLVRFLKTSEGLIIQNEWLLPFYNRVSDFLFILARNLDENKFVTVDYSILSKDSSSLNAD
ncbi:MAG: ATP:cob(I)alamin adenosyltransferase [Candidatus Hydrogenedentes bacterium]|nr:ATP:cob(I)alamin adenosyltransferase [Candidatus Hydrogenedentota bacterium]